MSPSPSVSNSWKNLGVVLGNTLVAFCFPDLESAPSPPLFTWGGRARSVHCMPSTSCWTAGAYPPNKPCHKPIKGV
jgi:hypothetical protein